MIVPECFTIETRVNFLKHFITEVTDPDIIFLGLKKIHSISNEEINDDKLLSDISQNYSIRHVCSMLNFQGSGYPVKFNEKYTLNRSINPIFGSAYATNPTTNLVVPVRSLTSEELLILTINHLGAEP